jgi:hypothetical protein
MNKQEADKILLACKKHGISFTMRKEGSVYLVTFLNRIEIKSFEGAKLITNGLVVEGRHKTKIKEHIVKMGTNAKLSFSNTPKRKIRGDNGITFADRHGGIEG